MIYLYILGSIIIINFWIAAKTQTVFPNKSIIYRKKPQQWSVVKCLVLLWISILPWEILKFGEPLGKKRNIVCHFIKKKKKERHRNMRTCLTWWAPGAVFVTQWKSVKLFFDVLSNAAQMFLHNKYIGIFSKKYKKLNINYTAWLWYHYNPESGSCWLV